MPKKRSIIASEDPATVTPPSTRARVKRFALGVREAVGFRKGGIGGTIGEIKRSSGKPPAQITWKAGLIGSKASKKLSAKAKAGFRFKVKF